MSYFEDITKEYNRLKEKSKIVDDLRYLFPDEEGKNLFEVIRDWKHSLPLDNSKKFLEALYNMEQRLEDVASELYSADDSKSSAISSIEDIYVYDHGDECDSIRSEIRGIFGVLEDKPSENNIDGE